jgi:hypothetical protein
VYLATGSLAELRSGAVAGARRVTTNAQSLIPAIRAWGGGFFAAWIELEGEPHEGGNSSEVVVAFVP